MKKIVFLILCMAMISAVTFADDEKGKRKAPDKDVQNQEATHFD